MYNVLMNNKLEVLIYYIHHYALCNKRDKNMLSIYRSKLNYQHLIILFEYV